MPLYEYQCEACGHRFEVIQKFSDDLVSVCPNCGKGPVVKLLSSPAIQFKGSGWYITDYARQGGDKKTDKGEKTEKPAGADAASSDTSTKKDATKSTTSDTSAPSKPADTTPAKSS